MIINLQHQPNHLITFNVNRILRIAGGRWNHYGSMKGFRKLVWIWYANMREGAVDSLITYCKENNIDYQEYRRHKITEFRAAMPNDIITPDRKHVLYDYRSFTVRVSKNWSPKELR